MDLKFNTKQLSLCACIALASFGSCTDDEIINAGKNNSEKESTIKEGLISIDTAAIWLQEAIDVLQENNSTRGGSNGKKVSINGIVSGCLPSTRSTNSNECDFYVIPFEDCGYGIVSANDDEIYAIIPNDEESPENVKDQILSMQNEIALEERTFQLEDYILARKGLPLPIEDEDQVFDLGDVLLNERLDKENGYTIWYNAIEDTVIFTVGYSNRDSNFYVSTFYINGTEIVREAGDTTINESEEWSLISSQLYSEQNKDNVYRKLLASKNPVKIDNYNYLYQDVFLKISEDAEKVMEIKTKGRGNVECEIHRTTCNASFADGKNILNYNIYQQLGFEKKFSNGHAGCGPVALAILYLQTGCNTQNLENRFTMYDYFFGKSGVSVQNGGELTFGNAAKEPLSDLMRDIAGQCNATYFKEGTAISKDNMNKFLRNHFDFGHDVDYKESRVKKQIDRNMIEIIYGRDSGGLKGVFSQHYFVCTAYAIFKRNGKETTLAYYNTCKSSPSKQGWYTMTNRIGYRHRNRLFEPVGIK
ncbi:MAG: hypothetical protein E7070_11905 [Bacteroidales bacterium]|jgi:hypothetical protein|nr:hypothetical protein [Bacteroidales bacterium]